MHNDNRNYDQRVKLLEQASVSAALTGIQHGVERECLRVNPDGSLAQTQHPTALGAALTHHFITTDFSESLLEFITPPECDSQATMAQLADIHKFTVSNLDRELLWPMSMPCDIADSEDVKLAYYGESNVGKMKTLYRQGLKNRYGSKMQTIAGIHFNVSLPESFWSLYLATIKQQASSQDNISSGYFSLLRNYKRYSWVLPYLFGASPAMGKSFVSAEQTALPLQSLGKDSWYLPYATSLRMSDLGYTNNAQSGLRICYNNIDNYVQLLRKATQTPSAMYAKFAGKVNGEYQQLNNNILQIENELYSSIRPKQPTLSLEKPTDALAQRGVSYVEVRVLDVNPFSPVGITLEQMRFLDVFLVYCLIKPSPQFDDVSAREAEGNLKTTILEGRKPGATLYRDGRPVALAEWATKIFDEMSSIAEMLDRANGTPAYSTALELEKRAVVDPNLTVSGRLLSRLLDAEVAMDNRDLALQLGQQYQRYFRDTPYQLYHQNFFDKQAETSRALQTQIEAEDTMDFDRFLQVQFGS